MKQNVTDEKCVRNYDAVLAISDEDKKIPFKVNMRHFEHTLHGIGIAWLRQIQLVLYFA